MSADLGSQSASQGGELERDSRLLRVWRLHPTSCPIVPAEKTLRGTASRGGVRWCGPYTNANRAGWWVFPPVDIDFLWKGGTEFDYEVRTPYSDADSHLIRFLLQGEDDAKSDAWLPKDGRTKFSWGLVEPGVVQIWTGCIFETPPDWGLHIRSPINVEPRHFHVMEAVLETDWLQYDIWLNIVVDRPNEVVRLRRDEWPPIAQLVPVRRDAYDPKWKMDDRLLNRESPEGERVFRFFADYNRKKFAGDGRDPLSRDDPSKTKDASIYFKERKRVVRVESGEA